MILSQKGIKVLGLLMVIFSMQGCQQSDKVEEDFFEIPYSLGPNGNPSVELPNDNPPSL